MERVPSIVHATINTAKNRQRDPYSFANINLLGGCNVRCFFCLGADMPEIDCFGNKLMARHYSDWNRFDDFKAMCHRLNIKKVYITGQNTDALLYPYLADLINHLHAAGFQVGLRTNGYALIERPDLIDTVNAADLSVGYSIHSLDPMTTKMILGRPQIPSWGTVIPLTKHPRVSIVLNRCNEHEFFALLRYLSGFRGHVRYIQVRRVSTDTREDQLMPDMVAFEKQYTKVREIFPLVHKFAMDAEVYDIYGMDVVFWRTIKTSVNSINYFIDGTLSDLYFVVEGYRKYREGVAP